MPNNIPIDSEGSRTSIDLKGKLIDSVSELAEEVANFYNNIAPTGIEADFFASDFEELESKYLQVKIDFTAYSFCLKEAAGEGDDADG